jgi:sulfur carrier protein ThiS
VNIVYQGKTTETASPTVGAFLAAIGVDAGKVIIEYKGDILSAEAAASAPLEEGAELNAFKIVAGG